MAVLVGLAFGAAVAVLLWRSLRITLHAPVFLRRNYRNIDLPVAAGLVLVLVLLLAAGIERGLFGLGIQQHWLRGGDLLLLAALGFGLLGLIDDLAGDAGEKGFAGHLRALFDGRLTTGGLKLLGGGVLAVVLAGSLDGDQPWRMAVDAALIALSANLANLFDRAPGRVAKVGLVVGGALLLTHLFSAPAGAAVVMGGLAGLLWFDLREELMLGDTGSNLIGGVLGTGLVISSSFEVRVAALLIVLALNLTSEWVSFSSVIDRTPPLRYLDRLGRRQNL